MGNLLFGPPEPPQLSPVIVPEPRPISPPPVRPRRRAVVQPAVPPLLPNIRKIGDKAQLGQCMWEGTIIGPVPLPSHPGLLVYTLPVGVQLYHGTAHPMPTEILDRPGFFSSPSAANIYCQRKQCKENGNPPVGGYLYEYTVKQPVILLALDQCSTLNTLAQIAAQQAHGCVRSPLQ